VWSQVLLGTRLTSVGFARDVEVIVSVLVILHSDISKRNPAFSARLTFPMNRVKNA
jgi:hypothetical protein